MVLSGIAADHEELKPAGKKHPPAETTNRRLGGTAGKEEACLETVTNTPNWLIL